MCEYTKFYSKNIRFRLALNKNAQKVRYGSFVYAQKQAAPQKCQNEFRISFDLHCSSGYFSRKNPELGITGLSWENYWALIIF